MLGSNWAFLTQQQWPPDREEACCEGRESQDLAWKATLDTLPGLRGGVQATLNEWKELNDGRESQQRR
jgi:hypothetical protein